ncbi:hypothetical protein T02_11644 [Trichinella nativa]|uniref:Uncharacterized protein n=1 Tax=Trichinella nativa TaxID=6335 RepID=A0A0V1KGV2_9BILA|nr:hypothetical protein T02_11644 [Trichinella nativa]
MSLKEMTLIYCKYERLQELDHLVYGLFALM